MDSFDLMLFFVVNSFRPSYTVHVIGEIILCIFYFENNLLFNFKIKLHSKFFKWAVHDKISSIN